MEASQNISTDFSGVQNSSIPMPQRFMYTESVETYCKISAQFTQLKQRWKEQ